MVNIIIAMVMNEILMMLIADQEVEVEDYDDNGADNGDDENVAGNCDG